MTVLGWLVDSGRLIPIHTPINHRVVKRGERGY